MPLFFVVVQIKAVENIVRMDIALFQEIWEQTYEEQEEASLLDIMKYNQHHEDINMGWINVHWGVPHVLNVSISFFHEANLDKVVEQVCVSLLLTQFTIMCCDPSLGLATKARACKGAGQKYNPRVTFAFLGM
jgi:HD-like signal output (HDOD) protein